MLGMINGNLQFMSRLNLYTWGRIAATNILWIVLLCGNRAAFATEASNILTNYKIYTPDSFLESGYLTIVNTQNFTGQTINFQHSSQIVFDKHSKNKIFVVDHLDNRVDRLLCLEFRGSEDVVRCYDITRKLNIKLYGSKDFCRLKIVKTLPLTLAVVLSLESNGFKDKSSKRTVKFPLDNVIPKEINLIDLLVYKNFWSDEDPYRNSK